MPECGSSENKGNEENGAHERVGGHATSSLGLALLLGDARVEITAANALRAHFRLRPFEITIANCSENSINGETPTKSNGIDKSRGEDNNTALGLCLHLQVEESIGLVLIKSTAIPDAAVDHICVDFSMLISILHTIFVRKIIRCVTAFHELGDIIPPLRTDPIGITVMLPDTDTPQTLLNDISSRNAMIKVIVRVGGAVPSIVGAKVETHVLPIKALAVALNSIIDIHVGGEVRTVPQSLGDGFELLLKILAHRVGGGGPQIVLHAIVGFGERPLHFHLDHVVRAEFGFDLIRVLFEHEEGGDRNVSPGSVIGHDGLGWLAHVLSIGRDAILVRAEASVVRDNYTGGSCLLGVADFLNERATASVNHKDVGSGPGFHVTFAVLGADWISLAAVDGRVAEVGISIVNALRDGSTIGRDSKESFTMIVSFRTEKRLRDLN